MLKRESNGLYTKSQGLRVKAVDPTGRTVTFYGSKFGNLDSDGDIVMPGAYAKTIAENGPAGTSRIKMLWQHDARTPIGRFTELKEDDYGLLCTAVIANTQQGNDALALYAEDLLEHSIGYRVIKGNSTADGYQLLELGLREVSAVTFGANPLTPLVGMKGEALSPAEEAAKLETERAKLYKALRAGNLTDDTYEMLELGSQHIDRRYRELLTAATAPKSDPAAGNGTETKGQPTTSALAQFFNHLATA